MCNKLTILSGNTHKMKAHTTPEIKLISQCYVKPKYETKASKNPYYLGPVDLAFLSLEQMQKGLLFNTKPNSVQSDLFDKLKSSMSHALVHYYPLAGRLATEKFHDEHAIWVYVDCNKGPGAGLIHAAVDLTVSDIVSSTDVAPIVRSFFDLGAKTVNHDAHTRPLLSVQVTELINGVFIGFTMNHSIADGTSLWNFISTLSEVFLKLEVDGDDNENGVVSICRQPMYEPFFPDGYGPMIKLPYLEPEEFVVRSEPRPLRERMFRFSPMSMSMLKAKANEECGGSYISSYQALSGFLWRSITRVRNLQPDQETSCTISLCYRTRVKPPFSQDNFGNFIAGAQGTCKVSELLDNGFGWAASLLHQCLMSQDDSAIREHMSTYVKAPYVNHIGSTSAFYKPNSVLIGGSPKFDMYGPEFGLGRAVAVLAGYANKDDGKVTANPGREGGGSVDLEVCLKPEIMNALELDEEFMSFVSK